MCVTLFQGNIRSRAFILPQAAMKDVEIPRSIPKLTTARVLTMSFVEGDPITRLKVSPYGPIHLVQAVSLEWVF